MRTTSTRSIRSRAPMAPSPACASTSIATRRAAMRCRCSSAALVGLTAQGVRATATAQAAIANASDCLKPWAIPDRWIDNHDEDGVIDTDWTMDDRFETHYDKGPNKGQPAAHPRSVREARVHAAARRHADDAEVRESERFAADCARQLLPGGAADVGRREPRRQRLRGEHRAVQRRSGQRSTARSPASRERRSARPRMAWKTSSRRTRTRRGTMRRIRCRTAARRPQARAPPSARASSRFRSSIPDGSTKASRPGGCSCASSTSSASSSSSMQGQDVSGVFMRIPGVVTGAGANVNPNAAFMQVPLLVR